MFILEFGVVCFDSRLNFDTLGKCQYYEGAVIDKSLSRYSKPVSWFNT